MNAPITMTLEEWRAEAEQRFGPNPEDWRFVCPVCSNEASGLEFKKAGARPDAMRCECIGRHTKGRSGLGDTGGGPCDYAGYGFIRLSPVRVVGPDGKTVHSFAFGEGGGA